MFNKYSFIFIAILALSIFVSLDLLMYSDEGIWHYIGFQWSHGGLLPYRDMVENKTPGIFYIYYLSNIISPVDVLLPRIFSSVAITLGSIFLYRGLTIYVSRNTGILAALLFGLSSCWGIVGGESGAVTETFMTMFVCLSFYQFTQSVSKQNSTPHLILAGAALGAAIAFKQVAIASTAGLMAFYLLSIPKKQRGFFVFAKSTGYVCCGIVIATVASIIPILISGVTLMEYIDGAWLILLRSGSSMSLEYAVDREHRLMMFLQIFAYSRLRFFYFALPAYILFRRSENFRKISFIGLFVWFLAEFLATNASGYYYNHQLRQMLPVLSVISAIGFTGFVEAARPRCKHIFVVMVGVCVMLWLPYLRISASIEDLRTPFTAPEKSVGLWLRQQGSEDDMIYVFDSAGSKVLALAHKKSPSRYFNLIFWSQDVVKKEIVYDILKSRPRYFVIPEWSRRLQPENLSSFIAQNYTQVKSFKSWVIHERKD